MSRAYRIKVRESLIRVHRAEDRVSTHLELLEVLPPDQMAGLLAAELEQRGFERQGAVLVRREADVTVTVEPASGQVTVSSEAAGDIRLEGSREGHAYDDAGPHAGHVRDALQESLRADLEKQAREKESLLQDQVTDRLEGRLGDVREELDQVVNRVTAEALKR